MKRYILLICFLLHNIACSDTNISYEEQKVSFYNDSLAIEGVVSFPKKQEIIPAIILVSGSGPIDKNYTIYPDSGYFECIYPTISDTIFIFKSLSNSLTKHGFFVLRYDKRNISYNSKAITTLSPYDFISDIHTAIEYTKNRPEVDSNEITLIGHSQGGNLLPIVANDRNDISALIAISTPLMRADSSIRIQINSLLDMCLTEHDSVKRKAIMKTDSLLKNALWTNFTPIFGWYKKYWDDWNKITESTITSFNNVRLPKLFIYGTRDFNVPLSRVENETSKLDSNNTDIYHVDGMTHFLTSHSTGEFDHHVTDTIIKWIKSH